MQNKLTTMIATTAAGMLILSACGGAAPAPTSVATSAPAPAAQPAQPAQGQPAPNQIAITPEMQLLAGTFNLKGTEQAITKEQAAKLIALWQKVKDINAQMTPGRGQGQGQAQPGTPQPRATVDPALTAQLDAAVKDIQAAMTPAQMQAIAGMNITRDSMNTILQAQGVQMGGPQNGGAGNPNANPPPQGTPPAGGGQRGGFGGFGGFGLPSQWVDALIQYLGQI